VVVEYGYPCATSLVQAMAFTNQALLASSHRARRSSAKVRSIKCLRAQAIGSDKMSNGQDTHMTRRNALRRIGAAMVAGAAVTSAQALLAAAPAQAQNNPLVGTWSTRMTNTRGEPTGVIFVTFHGDGRFQQRIIVPAGTIDYVGTYRLSADRRLLQSTFHNYSPRQICSAGICYPVPSGVPLNQALSTSLNWLQPNLFVSEDASGPLRWIRQG
jgi:hypothetical protein